MQRARLCRDCRTSAPAALPLRTLLCLAHVVHVTHVVRELRGGVERDKLLLDAARVLAQKVLRREVFLQVPVGRVILVLNSGALAQEARVVVAAQMLEERHVVEIHGPAHVCARTIRSDRIRSAAWHAM